MLFVITVFIHLKFVPLVLKHVSKKIKERKKKEKMKDAKRKTINFQNKLIPNPQKKRMTLNEYL